MRRLQGVAAVVTLWTTIGLGMHRAGLAVTDERPISYLGVDPRARVLFSGGLAVATILFVGFAWEVHRRLPRAAGFLAVFLVGMAGQAVVAVVPVEGSGAEVHTTAGLLLGLSLPVLMWRFATAQPPGRWRRIGSALTGLEVGACLAGTALSRSGLATLAEVAPAAGFHLWIFVVTFGWPCWRDHQRQDRPPQPDRSDQPRSVGRSGAPAATLLPTDGLERP